MNASRTNSATYIINEQYGLTLRRLFDEKEFMVLMQKEHFQIWSGTFLCKLTLALFIPMAFTVNKSLFRDNMKILLGNGALKMQPV